MTKRRLNITKPFYPVKVNRIGTVYLGGSNKVLSSRFCLNSRVRHVTPEEGRKTYRPKRCDYNNKDEANSPNIQSNNNKKKLQSSDANNVTG